MDKIKQTYSLGDYLIELSKTNDHFFIEIEAPGSGRMFSVELENDAIHQVSEELFKNAQEMFQAFEGAIQKTYPDVSLTFNGSGKLTYRFSFSVGPIKKNQEFTIELQEKKVDALTMFERKVENRFEKLSQKIAFLEQNSNVNAGNGFSSDKESAKSHNSNEDIGKRFDLLEKRIFDKFEVLEKKINSFEETKLELQRISNIVNRLENRILEKKDSNPVLPVPQLSGLNIVDWSFGLSSPQAKKFAISNSNKTARHMDLMWSEIALSKPLPRTGTAKINLQIDDAPHHIWFGFVTSEAMRKMGWHYKGIYFSTSDGGIYANNKIASSLQNVSQGKGKAGDILSFIIDMDQDKFSVQINGVEVNSFVGKSQDNTYYPYCGAYSQDYMDKIKNRYSLGEYLVELSKTNDHLFIEIEAPGSGRMFFVELENDAIHQVSQELFKNAQEMFQAFEGAIQKTYPEVSLTFNGSGKLTYRFGFSVGPIKKDHEFTIELQEKKIDALTMFERRVENRFEKLSQKIAFLEQNGAVDRENSLLIHKEKGKLSNDNTETDRRLDFLEKRIFDRFEVLEKKINSFEETRAELQNLVDIVNRLENKILEKKNLSFPELPPESNDLNWKFDPLSPKAPDFEFSNSYKTARNISSSWSEISLSKLLPATGTTKINLKIETAPNHIWFGFAMSENMNNPGWHEKGIYFSTYNGAIYANNKIMSQLKNSSQGTGREGDVLSFIVDMDQKKFSVQINGVLVNSFFANSKYNNYFPYCGADSHGCKFSIV